MDPQSPPHKIACIAGTTESRLSIREDSPPPNGIGLGLELGCGSSGSNIYSKTCCGFTMAQLQELQLQSVIYKYMEAGLPIPHHLVLPIWKSVANSLSHLNGALFQLFPTFFGSGSGGGGGGGGSLSLEYRNGMDAEPGRCRRTDGKKWRCSKDAVPDHKYCERHVHRGRQRSRKLVEASSHQSADTSTTTATSRSTSNFSVNSGRSIGNNSVPTTFFGFSTK